VDSKKADGGSPFSSTMNEHQKAWKRRSHAVDAEYALGFFVHYPGSDNADEFAEVVWGSSGGEGGADGWNEAGGGKWAEMDNRHFAGSDSRGEGRKEPIEFAGGRTTIFTRAAKIDYHEGERFATEAIAGKAECCWGNAEGEGAAGAMRLVVSFQL